MGKYHLFIAALLYGLLLLVIPLFTPTGYLGEDSKQYSEFARAILQGEFFRGHADGAMTVGEQLRAPGYPLILATSVAFFGGSPGEHFVVTHFLLGLFGFVFFATALREQVHPLIVMVALSLCSWELRDFYNAHTSEWSAFSLLLVAFALIYRFLLAPSAGRIFAVGVAISAAILVRPALLGVALALVLLPMRKLTVSTVLCMLCSLFPIFIWLGVNSYRVGTPSIAAKDGLALIAAASLLGDAPISPASSADMLEFSTFMNLNAKSASQSELCCASEMPNERLTEKSAYNARLAKKWGEEHQINWVSMNALMKQYSLAVIGEHWFKYLLYLIGGIIAQVSWGLLLLPGLLVAALLIRRRTFPALGWLIVIAAGTHFLHIGGVLLTQPILPRYMALTFYLAAYLGVLGGVVWGTNVFLRNNRH